MAQRVTLPLLPWLFLAIANWRSAAGQELAPETLATGDLVSGYMQRIVDRRVVAANELKAQRDEMMEAAANLTASLNSSQAWESPLAGQSPVEGTPVYVDLTQAPPPPADVELDGFNFTPPNARYPRMPSIRTVPPVLLAACPSTRSTKLYGARGDGKIDDAGAITKACTKSKDWVYFPPGNYRISQSITINRPIVVGGGATLIIDRGVTLTLTQQPHHWDKNIAMFGGRGRVMFTRSADTVYPDWFKNTGESDSDAMQQAIDSCSGACTLMLTRAYFLNKAVYLKPNVGIISSNAGQLVGRGSSTGEGIVLLPGKYTRPLSFGTMWGFQSFAIKIRGGVAGADIQLSTIVEGGDGVVFAPDEGSKPIISNVFVTHMTATNAVQNSVVFRASSATQSLVNCLVRANFIVAGGFLAPTQQSAGLVLRGAAAPLLMATSVIFQAVDAAQFAVRTKFALLQNVGAQPANNVFFWLDAWGGGLEGDGKVIAGKFNNLRARTRMAGGVPTAQQFMEISGGANKVTMSAVASAGAEHVLPSDPNRALFNNGSMVLDQVTYLNAPINGTWGPGQVRTFYAYSAFAPVAGTRIRCLPFRASNTGVVFVGAENQNAASPGQIAIRLQNTASYDIPSWQTSHRFGLQVGP